MRKGRFAFPKSKLRRRQAKDAEGVVSRRLK